MDRINSNGPIENVVLIFRLSSLGDVILATAALSALPEGYKADWVVSEEFASLLQGHPRVRRVIVFERKKKSFTDWISLCRLLAKEPYSEVFDLHLSLRTRIARVVFFFAGKKVKVISKQGGREKLYFLFKGALPQVLRPRPWVELFSKLVSEKSHARPDLSHLSRSSLPAPFDSLPSRAFLTVMPSSKWPGKKWPFSRFVESLSTFELPVVVLGTNEDKESIALFEVLKTKREGVFSAIGKLTLPETAALLSKATAHLGNDTGLSHLAESVGTRAFTLFGPTISDQGFGPFRENSAALEASLWCRPCGKYGRYCHRVVKRYECFNRLTVESVLKKIETKGVITHAFAEKS